jgi:hypothetical protein
MQVFVLTAEEFCAKFEILNENIGLAVFKALHWNPRGYGDSQVRSIVPFTATKYLIILSVPANTDYPSHFVTLLPRSHFRKVLLMILFLLLSPQLKFLFEVLLGTLDVILIGFNHLWDIAEVLNVFPGVTAGVLDPLYQIFWFP